MDAVGPPVIVLRPVYRRVRVLDNRYLSELLLGAHYAKVPPKRESTKRANKHDGGDRSILDLPEGCLKHLLPQWVQ